MRERILNWYAANERRFSSLALVGGFVFDIFALDRVDEFWENLWVGAHLIVAAAGILVLNYYLSRPERAVEGYRVYNTQFWLIFIIQFAFGGLLSTFLVFYFRSSSLVASWPFMLLLALAFVGNEAFKKSYAQLSYQTTILFLSTFSFAIYVVPIVMKRIGDDVFLISGFVSLLLMGGFVHLLRYVSRDKIRQGRVPILVSAVAVYVVVNLLYFSNIIPPIPLSLKDAGIYHSVTKNSTGNFDVTREREGIGRYFDLYQPVHVVLRSSIYVFTAIFSPTELNATITHEWQYFNPRVKNWIVVDRVTLPVRGGRGAGYRTYSRYLPGEPGKYRVYIKTPTDQVLGVARFRVDLVETQPALETLVR